jgi:hypothetical protein
MCERLRDHRAEHDDVDRGEVGSDGAILAAATQDLFESDTDVGPEGQGGLINWERSAVHGEHEFRTMVDDAIDETADALDRWTLAVGGTLGCRYHHLEGTVGERRQEGLA